MASPCSSGSDAFDEDMEALRRARSLAGESSGGVAGLFSYSDSGGEDSGADDVELLRRLQERFSLPSADSIPVVKPLSSIQFDSDDEDDLETLRAIRRRFSQYEGDTIIKTSENYLQETEMVVGDLSYGQTPNILAKDREFIEQRTDPGYTELCEAVNGAQKLPVKALTHSHFPKSAQNFVNALKKNRSLQRFMRRKLIEVEAKIEENKELKERIRCLMDFQVACKQKAGCILSQKRDPRVRLISAQKPRISKKTTLKFPAFSFGPAENSHVCKYKMVMNKFPISIRKQKWSTTDKEKLVKGVKQQYQEMLLLNSVNFESDWEGSINLDMMPVPLDSDHDVTHEKIRSFLPLVNWDRLVLLYLPSRSGAECESRWLNCEDPMINHSPWTKLEDKKLLFIVQERGIYNWIDIAIALGTQRTPFQCLTRYQRSLNPHILNKDWTKDEDDMLREAIETFGDKNWQIVASNLEGRTNSQCSDRWRKILNPDRKKVGRWSVDEDKRLKVAATLFGAKNWNRIAQFAPGRTQGQCRERWRNCLDPSLNLEPWTQVEDAQLLAAIDEHGYRWSRVASCVPPRTDSQCMRRWKVLRPDEVPLLQAARQMKRTVLITNFVGRENERPSIGASDFSSLANSPTSESGNRITMGISSDKQPKKSRCKRKNSLKENSREVKSVNSTEDTAGDLCLISGVNTNTAASGGIKKTWKKPSSGKRAKKSREKSERSFGENLTTNNVASTAAEGARVDSSLVPHINSNSAESRSAAGTRKKISSGKSRRSLGGNLKIDSIVNSSQSSPVDVPPVPGVNTNFTRSGILRRRKKTQSDTQPRKSGDKFRISVENLTADRVALSPSETAPVPFSLIPGVNPSNGESGSIKRLKSETSRDNEAKKSSDQSRMSLEENLVADGLVNSCPEVALADSSFVHGLDSPNSPNAVSGRTKRTGKNKRSDNQPKKKRKKCKRVEEILVEDDMAIASAEVASSDVSHISEINSITSASGNETSRKALRTNTGKKASCDGLQHGCSKKFNDENKIRSEDTNSLVNVCAAENVPLRTWLCSYAIENKIKRMRTKTSRPRASNEQGTFCDASKSIPPEKPRSKRKKFPEDSMMNGNVLKGYTVLQNEIGKPSNLTKQGSNQLAASGNVVPPPEHVVDVTVTSAPMSNGTPITVNIPVSITVKENAK